MIFKGTVQKCRNCGTDITGYVDECPSCGVDKPVPVPKSYYAMGAVIAVLIVYFLSDLGSVLGYFFGF